MLPLLLLDEVLVLVLELLLELLLELPPPAPPIPLLEELLPLPLELLLLDSDPPLPPVSPVFGSSLQPAMRANAPTKLMRIAYFMKKPLVK